MKRIVCSLAILALLCMYCHAQDDSNPEKTSTAPVDASRLPTGRLLAPAGESISFHGRPVDLQIGPEGKRLFVKDRNALRIFSTDEFRLVQTLQSPGGASLYGIAVANSGNVYFTNSKNGLHVFVRSKLGASEYKLDRSIELPADSFPCGIKVSPDETRALVCLSKKNMLAVVDLKTNNLVGQIDVGVAPFDVLADWKTNMAFVSNIGGRRPVEADQTATSAGTKTVVDERGIASTGTISRVDLDQKKSSTIISTRLHPSVMSWGESNQELAFCNTNSDSVQRHNLASQTTIETNVRPDPKLPFGSMPNAILFLDAPDGRKHMLVALAGNNALSVFDSSNGKRLGLIPTGWYPAAIAANQEYIYVANIKGSGSRAVRRDQSKGRNSHDHFGSVQRIKRSLLSDPSELARHTETVKNNGRFPQILRARADDPIEHEANTIQKPVPIPTRLGEPSVFKHVIYVIKENRTYDQVFGDIENARGEPALCVFPRKITPNHHALADRFGVLDNYYCNGVLSADGHSWATEGNVTPYLERAFGGFARSYTFGDDPITYSSSGFIWDHILAAGLSFRNYGEMNYSTPPKGMKYQEIWQAYSENKPIQFQQKIGVKRLLNYSCREYPGWNMVIPDVLRMDRFLNEFREFEKNDGLPSLCLLYLPQDHLGGGVTSEAHMADNDLALGRLVEAVSNSKYWKDTVIFVNEDDPQNGYDHIDGHRSICLAISAYSKRGVNHSFYNQTSVLRTMLHIFGLPPMNQQDASMPLMTDCFVNEPNLAPYTVIQANIPLNQTAAPKKQQAAAERMWREILASVPIQRTGIKTRVDEDNLNRFVWHEIRGWDTPYPAEWSGAHGRGLHNLGLKIDPDEKD